MHLAVKDDETTASAVVFLEEALAALPFQVTHGLTDRGFCFTADAFEDACQRHGVAHRMTRPDTPRTNGMVERFNGRVQREGLGITIYNHRISRQCWPASTGPTRVASAGSRGDHPRWSCASA